MKFELLYESYPIIESTELILKKIEEDDINDFFEIHSDEIIYKYIPGKAKKNINTVKNMIGHYERDFNKKKMIFLGIYIKKPLHKLVGIAEIFDIDKKISMVTIGYRLNPNYWGKGIATEATRRLTKYLIDEIKVNRIQAFVMTENKKSEEVLIRNHFEYEGTIRQGQMWKEKGIIDLKLYSLLREDFHNY